jgi:hypothetical protein
MNNLEKELLEVIRKIGPNGMPGAYSEATASVCLKWIEKAFLAGELHEFEKHFGRVPGKHPNLIGFLAENGLTESELLIGSEGITDPPYKTEEV